MKVLVEGIQSVEVGDVVLMEKTFYLVVELPSCVNYEVGNVLQEESRFYLHGLNGSSYWTYPSKLEEINQQIKEGEGKIYKHTDFDFKLVPKSR